jgi:hypothetical protein
MPSVEQVLEEVRLGQSDSPPADWIEQSLTAAVDAGVPKDQLENFLRSGIALQPKQWLMAAAARECDKPGGPVSLGVGGGRGGGKSHWLIAQMAADDCQRYPGLKCLLLRKEGKANREHLDDLRRTMLKGVPHKYKQQEGVLQMAKDSRIVVGHFQNEGDIDDYLGVEYDVIGIEEATTLSETKYRNIRTCLRSSKPGWRPRDYSTSNPGGLGHVWYRSRFVTPFKRSAWPYPMVPNETRFVPSLVGDNRFNNPEYVQILDQLPGWQRRAWLEGDWDIMAGQFFTNWREDVHVLKTWDDRQAHQWVCAFDYGMNHYTVVLLGAITGEGNIVIVDEHYARKAVPAWHVQEVKKMLANHGICSFDRLNYFVAGHDIFKGESDGSTVAATYDNLGMPLTCAEIDRVNGWGEMMRRMGDIDNGQRPTFFVHQKCRMLINQIPVMQHDPRKPEDVLKVDLSDNGEGGDDFVDCARYLVHSYKGGGSLTAAYSMGLGGHEGQGCSL